MTDAVVILMMTDGLLNIYAGGFQMYVNIHAQKERRKNSLFCTFGLMWFSN